MSLAIRIIPILLYRGTQLVKGKQFDAWRSVGHVLQAARIHAARGVDELLCLDIGATPEGRGPDLHMVEQITRDAFTPITCGGGVRSKEDVQNLLSAGADRVCIGTAAMVSPHLVAQLTEHFGSQAITVCVDYNGPMDPLDATTWLWPEDKKKAWSSLEQSPVQRALEFQKAGAGEVILQDRRRDGMMQGYDIPMVAEASRRLRIPVVIAGGGASYADMRAAAKHGANGVAAGALFQFTDATPLGAAEYLAAHGIEARVT